MHMWVLVPRFYYIFTGCKDFSHVDVGFFLPVGGVMEHIKLSVLHQKKYFTGPEMRAKFRQN